MSHTHVADGDASSNVSDGVCFYLEANAPTFDKDASSYAAVYLKVQSLHCVGCISLSL